MPQINCQLLTGYDKNTKKILAERLTDALAPQLAPIPL